MDEIWRAVREENRLRREERIQLERDKPRRRTEQAERVRALRWEAKGLARVTDPARGTVVVPCASKLGAIMCAAEVWGCDWLELSGAQVWRAEPGDTAAARPKKNSPPGGRAGTGPRKNSPPGGRAAKKGVLI